MDKAWQDFAFLLIASSADSRFDYKITKHTLRTNQDFCSNLEAHYLFDDSLDSHKNGSRKVNKIKLYTREVIPLWMILIEICRTICLK